ncbi:hypothetical protein NLU13_4187 [Sarocladium strictum]|uniref:Zn(2)-C6 fungal-type domain-containing protein n=1 Tax=Sarocladium strictum TaxID=5046 RepID=A0AA39GJS8_SARSR|nr:hypothetical protein NLU13_4187 [Sarocladium strictum]
MADTSTFAVTARTSCFACRNSKRRCDKALPACQLCLRKNVECRYPRRRGQRSASPADVGLAHHIGSASHTSSPSVAARWADASLTVARADSAISDSQTPASLSTFATSTAIRFLTPDLFRDLRLQSLPEHASVPSEILEHLGSRQDIRDTTNNFLRLTRSWMPIINGKRHLAAVLNPLLTPLRRHTALLALAMKLYCASASGQLQGERKHALYMLTKWFHSEVEMSDEMNISTMQAAIFIAVFEMGEAIYPAAYLRVGNLVRYGIAMGLDKINHDRLGTSYFGAAALGVPWIDVEEMRRVWWGVLILERLLNVSHPTWSLITKDPEFEHYLPVDDEKFYDASATPEDAAPISHAFHHRLGAFARLCQATYLITKVFELARSSDGKNDSHSPGHPPSDPVQLCRTLGALVRANEVEVSIRRLPFCTQSLVSYIGVLLLQQQQWQKQPRNFPETPPAEQGDLIFPETYSAIDTLDRISKMVQHDDMEDCPSPGRGQSTLFLVELVYLTISTMMMIKEGLPSVEFDDKIQSLRWLLKCMVSRWHLAGIYDRILEAKEALLAASEM